MSPYQAKTKITLVVLTLSYIHHTFLVFCQIEKKHKMMWNFKLFHFKILAQI